MTLMQKYRGWEIYRCKPGPKHLSLEHPVIYKAVKGTRIIEGVDIPDLKADIDEAERKGTAKMKTVSGYYKQKQECP